MTNLDLARGLLEQARTRLKALELARTEGNFGLRGPAGAGDCGAILEGMEDKRQALVAMLGAVNGIPVPVRGRDGASCRAA